jgi:hypothetical protein
MLKLNEANAVTAAGAAAGAFAGVRYGGALPAIGPLGGPLLLIVLGGILSAGLNLSGTTGDFARGVGFGLVATGVVGMAS